MKDWPADYRPPERATSAMWARCVECEHLWPVVFFPINMTAFGEISNKVRCPSCGAAGAKCAAISVLTKETTVQKPTTGRIVHLFSNLPQHGGGVPTATDPLAQRPVISAAIVTFIPFFQEGCGFGEHAVALTVFPPGSDIYPLAGVEHGPAEGRDTWWDWPARES